jgi:hypothetical protein
VRNLGAQRQRHDSFLHLQHEDQVLLAHEGLRQDEKECGQLANEVAEVDAVAGRDGGAHRCPPPGVDLIKPFRPKFADKTQFGQIT